MIVQDIMHRDVVTIAPTTTLPEAVDLAKARGIRHLPVVENGELVGIVSDRDLKRALPSAATTLERHEASYLLARLPVSQIMTRAVVTIAPMFPVEEAARLMVTEKVSALPVTEAGRLVGIVSETDVLEMLVAAMGTTTPSSRLDVLLKSEPSALSEVVHTVEATGLVIASIMTLVSRGGVREAVLRVATINPGPAVRSLEAKGYTVRDSRHGPATGGPRRTTR